MSQGILYLAFGAEYAKLAQATLAHSRRFTELPIHLITNQPIEEKWCTDNNVQTTFLDMPDNDNRKIKTNPIQYTPFDQTLYLDCDSVINKPGIEVVFTMLEGHDVVLHRFMSFTAGKKLFRIYKKAMKMTGTTMPMKVYIGALVAFNKNDRVRNFFATWLKYWEMNGSGRDMPSLACAAKNSELTIKEIGEKDRIISVMGADPTRIVVHRGYRGRSLTNMFGIAPHKQNKPFDRGAKGEWSMVNFDD